MEESAKYCEKIGPVVTLPITNPTCTHGLSWYRAWAFAVRFQRLAVLSLSLSTLFWPPKNQPCGLLKLVCSHLFQNLTSHGQPTTCLFATEGTRHYEPVWGCTGAVAAWTHADGNVHRRRCCCRCCRHIGSVNEHSTQKQQK